MAAATICGNGVLESPEECDDTNRRDGDGCNASCLMEIGICGDGLVQKLLGEQCEQSTFDPALPYDCRNCRFASRSCGDGKVDSGEECDDGLRNSTSPDAHCRPDCSLSHCGDGIRDTGEQCDDGNFFNGDGCNRNCRNADTSSTLVANALPYASQQAQLPGSQMITFPQYQNLSYQMPLGQMLPFLQKTPQTAQSGPAAVAAIGAGAAAGWSWVRRKRR